MIANHRPAGLRDSDGSESGLPPYSGITSAGSVCVRERRRERKGGVGKVTETGGKREGTERVVLMLMQDHRGRKDPPVKHPCIRMTE